MPTIALKEPAASRKSAVEPRDMFEAWHELSDQSQRRPIPWKIIAAAAALIVVASGIWFLLLPAAKHIAAPIAIIQPKPAPPPVESPKVTTGSIEVLTTPAGAKVLLDGKAVGTSPVTVPDVAVGRHGITVMAEAGAVRRTVRVDAGAKATLDIPIFSGFVAISAPIIFDVSERGRGLGTSENQIMLAPGRHELRLTNKDLFYSTTQTVDIEPGEILPLKIDPKGTANINAQPWAEVWVDGTRVGDTPLANLSLSIGVRDIVFRNPQYGERKVTATITAGTPATISVDMTKPQR
jgi:hypothetical protein